MISGVDDGTGKGEANDGILHLDEGKNSFSFCNTVFDRLTDDLILPPGSSGLTWIIELNDFVLFDQPFYLDDEFFNNLKN